MIASPFPLPHHPDRSLHAEEAVEPAFNSLAAGAEAAGWSQGETAFALLNLALARIMAIEANLGTDEAIARAARSIHGGGPAQTTKGTFDRH